MTYTTIISDASGKVTVWAWACWIKNDGMSGVFADALFQTDISSPFEAELGAMANALIIALRQGLLPHHNTVSLQSDSLDAIRVLRTLEPAITRYAPHPDYPVTLGKLRRSPTPKERLLVKAIRDVAEVQCLALELRHVKGHTGRPDGRHSINRIVDRRARAIFRAAVKGDLS